MAREMTPQERAAELCFKLALLVDADTHMEVDQDAMKAITAAITETRRAALLEAAQVANTLETMHDIKWWMDSTKKEVSAQTARDIAAALTKLAQEG